MPYVRLATLDDIDLGLSPYKHAPLTTDTWGLLGTNTCIPLP